MTAGVIAFFVLATVAVASALGVVTFRNPIYSMLSLILNLLSLAFFFLMLEAIFVATIQVLIYAGAVMVLFLFVVTMLTPEGGGITGPDRAALAMGRGPGAGHHPGGRADHRHAQWLDRRGREGRRASAGSPRRWRASATPRRLVRRSSMASRFPSSSRACCW